MTAKEPTAVARTRALLDAGHRDRPFDPDAGFLDLLDDAKTEHSPVMFAMRMPLVTKVYERYWRPGLGWLMKGFGGISMADEYELAAELLALKPGSVVLDLACGPGNFSRRFARKVSPKGLVVGYDGSRPMLERAHLEGRRETHPTLAFALGDASALPFSDESFDAVCCFAALHMFPDPLGSLDEIARVLKPGGHVALLTTHAPRGKRGLPVRIAGPASGQRMFRAGEIRHELESRGFVVETQRITGVAQIVGAAKR